MLDWHEFMAKEHQEDLLREARERRLIRKLRAARGKEHSPFPDDSQEKAHCAGDMRPRSSSACAGSGGF
jgi:hypothetical protein